MFHYSGEISIGAHEAVGIATDTAHPPVPDGKIYRIEFVSVAISLPGKQWPRVRIFEQFANGSLGNGHHLDLKHQGDFRQKSIRGQAYYVFSGAVRMYLRAGSTLACRFVREIKTNASEAERDCTCIFTAEGRVMDAD